jgi:predicted GNAT family acetyltransferase
MPDMLALAGATQPGPLANNRAWHIRGGVLVAMVGERMRLDGFTEASAVCVDPAHRGKGFAADLVRSLVTSIVARSETPFLHVFSSNHQAIALYRKLGFALRRQMHLLMLGRAEGRVVGGYSQPIKT